MDNLNELFGQVGICERASLVAQTVESACNAGDPDLIPGSGRSPGEGNGYLLQYSCLENPMDKGACPWGHKESNTTERLSLLSFSILSL